MDLSYDYTSLTNVNSFTAPAKVWVPLSEFKYNGHSLKVNMWAKTYTLPIFGVERMIQLVLPGEHYVKAVASTVSHEKLMYIRQNPYSGNNVMWFITDYV